ncbi:MAG: tyrosine-type recombinase/integrase [Oscillospiraceae bacterium]|nr:tyrosine-type recombinase/integrase [Oscillospiraceae bacterium]
MISKLLRPKAYFPTYNDAYQALIEYNRAACDTGSQATMKMLFEWWSMEHKQTLKTENSKKAIDSLWAYCTDIADMYISQVRSKDLKKCIENACTMVYGKERKASPVTKRRMKHLFDMMFDYAVENDLAQKNYARIFQLPPDIRELEEKQKTGHISFGDSEMERLKSNVGHIEGVDMLLIQSYSGWRPNEMLALEIKNVNIKEGYFVGGMKTKAGKDRKVPIHPFILPFVKARYDEAVQLGCSYLFPGEDKTHHMNYHSYDRIFHSVIKELGLDKRHRPHDCRVQFITMLKNAGADEYAIKHLAGHKISDITEKLYTKRSFEWLISELERIE